MCRVYIFTKNSWHMHTSDPSQSMDVLGGCIGVWVQEFRQWGVYVSECPYQFSCYQYLPIVMSRGKTSLYALYTYILHNENIWCHPWFHQITVIVQKHLRRKKLCKITPKIKPSALWNKTLTSILHFYKCFIYFCAKLTIIVMCSWDACIKSFRDLPFNHFNQYFYPTNTHLLSR